MRAFFAMLGSTRLAALLIALLAILAFFQSRSSSFESHWFGVPLALLSLNLFAAIVSNASFRRQPALLAFHVCLFAVAALAGMGTLTGFSGRVELVEGESLDVSRIEITDVGPLHRRRPASDAFVQGRISVDYLPNRVRQSTSSDVIVAPTEGGNSRLRIGDRRAFSVDGYRFSTTVNKGFAVLLHYVAADGNASIGSIHFPSYPEFDWKQLNTWTTQDGEVLEFELLLPGPATSANAWQLTSDGQAYSIRITRDDGTTVQLRQGDSFVLGEDRLTVAGLRLWMGYRVDANPTLPWLFAAAFLAIVSLAAHFNFKYWRSTRCEPWIVEEDLHVYVR